MSDFSCGSVHCAIGHGPAAGIPKLMSVSGDGSRYVTEGWSIYGRRCFWDTEREWDWMFASDWADVDNTAAGAAARIRAFLTSGVPEEFLGW